MIVEFPVWLTTPPGKRRIVDGHRCTVIILPVIRVERPAPYSDPDPFWPTTPKPRKAPRKRTP
jgi:hypothetical protein